MKNTFPYDIIRQKFYDLESTSDFIEFLNEVKKVFLMNGAVEKNGDIIDSKPITINRIKFYLANLKKPIDDKPNSLYRISKIPKKSGGDRVIHSPNLELKEIQKVIEIILSSIFTPHSSAFAFIDSKNIVDNAKIHVNHNFVYNIDLKDFFYSFDYNRIKTSFYKEPFILNTSKGREEIAYWISILATCKIDGKQVLPQGSPLSPILTNIICKRLDEKLHRLSKEFSINYSRYADDITFSSNHQVFHGKFQKKLLAIINSEGLTINNSKVRLQNQGERQVVTGLTVNKGLNVSKKYIKELRMYLYFIDRYGIKKASDNFFNDIQRKDGELKEHLFQDKIDYFQRVIKGKLNFLSMVKGKSDSVYVKLSERYNKHFPDKFTSLFEEVAIYSKLLGINKARELYQNKKKYKKYDRQYSLNSFHDNFSFDFIEFADINLDEENATPILEIKKKKSKNEVTEFDLNVKFLKQILGEEKIGELERNILLQAFSDYVNSKEIKKSDSKITHNPKRLTELIKMFGSDEEELKFTTHIWDGSEIKSFETFSERIHDKYKKVEGIRDLDSDMWWHKIFPFVFQNKLNTTKQGEPIPFCWGKYGINVGWNYPNFIRDWCVVNYDNKGIKAIQPFNIVLPQELLPETKVIDKVTLKIFHDIVNVFKKEIEFRGNDFYISIQYLFADILAGFDLDKSTLKTLKSFCVYTNTEKILSATRRIFEMIKMIEHEKEQNGIASNKSILIRSEFHEIEDDRFYTLEIIHLNSVCDKPINHPKLSGKQGDLANIIEDLKGRCDFSVIAEFYEGNIKKTASLDYLYPEYDKNNLSVRINSNVIKEPQGFSYWFKFYA